MDTIRKFNLREPKSTDRKLDFQTYHDLVMAVAREVGVDVNKEPTVQPILLMALDEDLPAYDENAEKDAATGNMPYIDKKGTVCYFDPADQKWKRDDTQQKVTLCNPYSTEFKKDDKVLFRYLQQCAKFVPCTASPGIGWVEGIVWTAFGRSDATFQMKITITHGSVPDKAGDIVTAQNTSGVFFASASQTIVEAKYDNELKTYSLIQLGCPPSTT